MNSLDLDPNAASFERVLAIMDLFTLEKPVWTADDMVQKMGLARATVYRYVKALVDRGYLRSIAGRTYTLGPRMVEFDRQIRLSDPLLIVGPPLMREIRDEIQGDMVLCSYYGDRVLTVHSESSAGTGHSLMFDRGTSFPLFRSMPSLVILANLPLYQWKNMMLEHREDIVASGLGSNWQEFAQALKAIQKAGYRAGPGQIDTQNLGIAAPIFRAPKTVIGSLSIGRPLKRTPMKERERLIPIVIQTAAKISAEIQRLAKADG